MALLHDTYDPLLGYQCSKLIIYNSLYISHNDCTHNSYMIILNLQSVIVILAVSAYDLLQ